MAVDGYMYFEHYPRNATDGAYLKSESQVNLDANSEPLCNGLFKFKDVAKANGLFEIEDIGFGIEQTLNIGSQSTGAGAGKVTFKEFTINRKIDISSPVLFEMACSGTPFKNVLIGLRKSSGGTTSGQIYLVFLFKLVAVKTIDWSYDDESPKEAITFEYGGLQVHYSKQDANGNMQPPKPGGWNRVRNVKDTDQGKEEIK